MMLKKTAVHPLFTVSIEFLIASRKVLYCKDHVLTCHFVRPIVADITPTQFILIDGKYKVNDFNRCRFMRVNSSDNSSCGFEVGMNPGKV